MESRDGAVPAHSEGSSLFESLISGLDAATRNHVTAVLNEQAAEQRAAGERGEPGIHRTRS